MRTTKTRSYGAQVEVLSVSRTSHADIKKGNKEKRGWSVSRSQKQQKLHNKKEFDLSSDGREEGLALDSCDQLTDY
ncbi:hypothetical protein NDU88_001980 [Pleurodeles waltl]|uniref:Uncharacterized protein n=1 Tax=Pleurodeles waltl TaxID=8319 RepID=A0AAV7P5T4_PLEWA|nr:hypothetical protein NDU88_001980 [Pleurodeles waltl]